MLVKFVVTICCVGPILSVGQETTAVDKNLENLASQYAECAAYFRLVYHAMVSSDDDETASAYLQLDDKAMFYSLLSANEGRSQDLAVEVTHSRIEMFMKMMKKEINNKNENISILVNKYHFDCQESMDNPSSQVVMALKRKVEEAKE
jgi:hypothetical protein